MPTCLPLEELTSISNKLYRFVLIGSFEIAPLPGDSIPFTQRRSRNRSPSVPLILIMQFEINSIIKNRRPEARRGFPFAVRLSLAFDRNVFRLFSPAV